MTYICETLITTKAEMQAQQQQQSQNHQQIGGSSVILKMNEIQQLSTAGEYYNFFFFSLSISVINFGKLIFLCIISIETRLVKYLLQDYFNSVFVT